MLLNSVIQGVSSTLELQEFLICLAGSAACGGALALIHSYKNRSSANFLMTLILLPMLVQTVIMMVNGNVGTGVAVAGAFSLVRFRSMPGNSREILSVFAAMAAGLATGMGFIALAVLMTAAFGILSAALSSAFVAREGAGVRELKVTIPESLDYSNVFDDIFEKYLRSAELLRVKTTNMGSLYKLDYEIRELDETKEKDMIDAIRVRNGNLNIVCGRRKAEAMEL